MEKGMSNEQTEARTPDFVAIGKAYGAGRNTNDEGAAREAEAHGRSVLDTARNRWNLQPWRDKKIKPCPRCGAPYCSKQCYVCSTIKKVESGWTTWSGMSISRERFEACILAHQELADLREKAKNNPVPRKPLSKNLRNKLFILQRGMCPCCNQPLGDNYHMDHIMPLALGGKNTDDNMQLLRKICNNEKHAKHPVDFMQERGFLL